MKCGISLVFTVLLIWYACKRIYGIKLNLLFNGNCYTAVYQLRIFVHFIRTQGIANAYKLVYSLSVL